MERPLMHHRSATPSPSAGIRRCGLLCGGGGCHPPLHHPHPYSSSKNGGGAGSASAGAAASGCYCCGGSSSSCCITSSLDRHSYHHPLGSSRLHHHRRLLSPTRILFSRQQPQQKTTTTAGKDNIMKKMLSSSLHVVPTSLSRTAILTLATRKTGINNTTTMTTTLANHTDDESSSSSDNDDDNSSQHSFSEDFGLSFDHGEEDDDDDDDVETCSYADESTTLHLSPLRLLDDDDDDNGAAAVDCVTRGRPPMSVRFTETVRVREYAVTVGDAATSNDSCPMTLDWGFVESTRRHKTQKKNLHHHRRTSSSSSQQHNHKTNPLLSPIPHDVEEDLPAQGRVQRLNMEQRRERIAAVQGLTREQVRSLEIERVLQRMEDTMQRQERFVDELICADDEVDKDNINKDQQGQDDVAKQPRRGVRFELDDDNGRILKTPKSYSAATMDHFDRSWSPGREWDMGETILSNHNDGDEAMDDPIKRLLLLSQSQLDADLSDLSLNHHP